MDILLAFWHHLRDFIPAVIALCISVIVLFGFKFFFEKRFSFVSDKKLRFQVVMLLLTFGALLAVILVLPISDSSRGSLLSLIGILMSAAIALSSTTLLGNAMAGLMLRVIRGFRSGDFIRVGEYFGRISEQGLFHVEIQNEDRDLTTLPNLYLVTNPVKVIRSSGTFISATVSLGYDITRTKIERALIEAAKAAELTDPFIHIQELGDFSITYRVAGLLTEVKQVISTRSRLHCMMLDKLHEAGIEIVSPNFMNTRNIPPDKPFIPKAERKATTAEVKAEAAPESKLFDKAEQAESREKLKEKYENAAIEIEQLKARLVEESDEKKCEIVQKQITNLETRRKLLEDFLKRGEDD